MRSPMHVLVVMALLIPGAVMAAPIKHEDVARTPDGLSRFVSPDVDQSGIPDVDQSGIQKSDGKNAGWGFGLLKNERELKGQGDSTARVVVPEPSTLGMLGSGLVALLYWRRARLHEKRASQ